MTEPAANQASWTEIAPATQWNIPEPSDWECELYGTGRNMVFRPTKGNEPNWFWRQMQYLAFGNRWVKRAP